jgi:hypothetical protein
MEEWVEAQLLPTVQRDAYFESSLIDLIATNIDRSTISSLQDCKLAITSYIKDLVKITTAGTANGAVDRVARKLFLYINTKDIGSTPGLDKMLKSIQKTLVINSPIVEQVYDDEVSSLVLSFPDFDAEDEDSLKVIAVLVGFAASLHQTSLENIRINKDSKLGSGKITIPASYKNLVNQVLASSKSSTGLYAGEIVKFNSGFNANIVEMIAAMRLLNLKQEFIRKKKFPSDSKKTPVTFNLLQESFNISTGLKSTGEVTFIVKFIKATLHSAIQLHNRGFPGGWTNACRTRNGVKSDFALLNILGWTEKVPSNHKALEVLFNTVDLKSKDNGLKKDQVVNITQDKRHFSYQEFRTAVALTLPRLDVRVPANHARDMKLDPLSVKDLRICKNFCEERRDLLVDSLNESYILKVSLKNPKSKTKEVHYKNFRDRLLNASANVTLIDARGNKFSKFSDIPEKTQKFLRDTFRYPSKRKEPAASDEAQTAENMVVDTEVQPQSSSRQKRTKTMTKGQAKEAIRKSGRLASMRAEKQ